MAINGQLRCRDCDSSRSNIIISSCVGDELRILRYDMTPPTSKKCGVTTSILSVVVFTSLFFKSSSSLLLWKFPRLKNVENYCTSCVQGSRKWSTEVMAAVCDGLWWWWWCCCFGSDVSVFVVGVNANTVSRIIINDDLNNVVSSKSRKQFGKFVTKFLFCFVLFFCWFWVKPPAPVTLVTLWCVPTWL